MLDIEEAAVRQRLGRARKQFQRFYELESGEEVVDNAETANDLKMSQNRSAMHHNTIERVDVRFPLQP